MQRSEGFSAQSRSGKIEWGAIARVHRELLLSCKPGSAGRIFADAIANGRPAEIRHQGATAGEGQFFSVREIRVYRLGLLLEQAQQELRHHSAVGAGAVGEASRSHFKFSVGRIEPEILRIPAALGARFEMAREPLMNFAPHA